jgi:hypothetical protein
MRKMMWAMAVLVFFNAAYGIAEEAPHQIGPFRLGGTIDEFAQFVDMRTELPIRYLENIKEVEIKSIEGFKSGLIAYGSCSHPGQVLRIKLKFRDDSKAFFKNLRKKIEARYGKFEEYRGDPFQVMLSWKKSFVDKKGNRISLTIQHNTRDSDEKMGNSIKLTMTNLLEADIKCYRAKASSPPAEPIQIPTKDPWELYVPQ